MDHNESRNDTWFRRGKTFFLIMLWVSTGMYMEIAGPTLLDMRLLLHTNFESIAGSVSGRGAGALLGAFVSGILVDRFSDWKDLIAGISQLGAALSIVMMPFIRDTGFLWFLFFASGAAAGMTSVAGQSATLELWEEHAASPMHALHMGFGIGALLVPIIVNPFLAKFVEYNTTDKINSSKFQNHDSVIILEESRVHVAYLIVSIIVFCIGVPFFIYQYLHIRQRRHNQYNRLDINVSRRNIKSRTFKEMINPGSYAGGSFWYGSLMFFLLFIFYFNLVGAEQLFGNFVRSFSVDELKFDKDSASYLNMLFWASFALGRFAGSIASKYISQRTLFAVEATLNLISVTFLDIFSTRNIPLLWFFTATNGLFIAPLYPAGISYGNIQIEITGIWVMMIIFGGGFGDMTYTWTSGHFYSLFGPRSILYVLQVSAVCIFIVAMVMISVGSSRKSRFMVHVEVEELSQLDTCQASDEDETELNSSDSTKMSMV
ncbi:hypothetical protein ACJMK2_029578 [Sinanodonta woodiana]|uniref:Uncharacterized protein n=1 Tax=Sinanodonta woodiana TaxID=1069815 RepID=A0ABD3XAK8_SINWO